jgi:flagellar hook-associated protein 1 FlgK
MLGLFGMLNLGSRSLQTQQQGVAVAGQNLANVNNPAYARQRVAIQTSLTIGSELGPQGTGAEAVAIVQIRSSILDSQIQSETSVRGSLAAQQLALQYAEANLGTQIDRLASGNGTQGVSGAHSLADSFSDLFNSFQSVSANPTSMAERQTLLMQAVNLTTQFNQIDQRLGNLQSSLDQSVQDDVASANQLLTDIAKLNNQISTSEISANGVANDLRDLRQQKIEDLARFVKMEVTTGEHGSADISISGTTMVWGNLVAETLQAYDAGGGQILICTASTAAPLTLTGGSIQGTIDARDGAVASLRTSINSLASLIISEVNAIHAAGFSLTGSTGANFFSGTTAADIGVNAALVDDPSLLQASGVAGATGDNQAALGLAQLANKRHASLNGQTLSQGYSQTVAALGQSLSSVNSQLSDQEVVENMLLQQRSSISGVSLDEEMADLTKFQKAFAASARLITTVDEMLDTIVNMKR